MHFQILWLVAKRKRVFISILLVMLTMIIMQVVSSFIFTLMPVGSPAMEIVSQSEIQSELTESNTLTLSNNFISSIFVQPKSEAKLYLGVASRYQRGTQLCEWVEHYLLQGCQIIFLGINYAYLNLEESKHLNTILAEYKSFVIPVPIVTTGSTVAEKDFRYQDELFLNATLTIARQNNVSWLVSSYCTLCLNMVFFWQYLFCHHTA